MHYAIIDIETTGLSAQHEKITEVAVIIHDGQKIIDEYITLLNPERPIPYFITRMTGISNEMVTNAPKFYEVARKLVEMTENCVFVAHNASFDYNFFRSEFRQLGFDFNRPTICTVKLSRKLMPGYRSYGLGNLCSVLGIKIEGRHRAGGDAWATTVLFEKLLRISEKTGQKLSDISAIPFKDLNENLDRKMLEALPESPGVYYFYDRDNELIYVGKSRNIKSRVHQHLANTKGRRAMEMKNRIANIDFAETGSELVALLLESCEIIRSKPLYNRAQTREIFNWGIVGFLDENGYHHLESRRIKKNDNPVATFENFENAKDYLTALAENFNLCQKLCGLYEHEGSCFQYKIKQCKGACLGTEPPETYNERVASAVSRFEYDHESFLAIDHGRNSDELSFVIVENGKYLGYGYAGKEEINYGIEYLKDNLKNGTDNRNTKQIIRNYLRSKKVLKLIRF